MASKKLNAKQNKAETIERTQKYIDEIETLKNRMKNMTLEHKLEIATRENEIHVKEIEMKDKEIQFLVKEKQIKDKEDQLNEKEAQVKVFELQMKAKEAQIKEGDKQIKTKEMQILKLENENKLLKIKNNKNENTTLENERVIENRKDGNDFYMNTDDLLTKGIDKYFLQDEASNSFLVPKKDEYEIPLPHNELSSSTYREWFEVMATRLTNTGPFVFEKFVLVKVKCKNPTQEYSFFSFKKRKDKKFFLFSNEENKYYEDHTDLNILTKGWRHDTASILILHPSQVLTSIKMEEGGMEDHYCGWFVDYIPNEYIYNEDGCFIILCLKDASKNIYQQIYSS